MKSITDSDDSNKLRCMTWSEQGSSGLLTDAYTSVYVSRQYARTFLSDTRHTSFYAIVRGCRNLEILIDETAEREYTEK